MLCAFINCMSMCWCLCVGVHVCVGVDSVIKQDEMPGLENSPSPKIRRLKSATWMSKICGSEAFLTLDCR